MRTIVLNKSYRNTVEIATYAGAINQTTDLELLDRHGKAVEEVYFSEEEYAQSHWRKSECGRERL